jgi:hypothetical protein
MSVQRVLQKITAALDQAGVAFMLTGSFASAYHGSPRSTQDIDLVIEATPAQLRMFVASLPGSQYYVDLDAALEAQNRQSMFNVIDLESGWKIDLIIRKNRGFSEEEFARRKRATVQQVSLFVATAEDVILAKLEWAKLAQSQRQIEDAAGIMKIQGDSLDRHYLEKWAGPLGLTNELNQARVLAGP